MSGLKFLLDTNVVIGLLKGNPSAIELAESINLDLSLSAVSQITRMELLGFRGVSDAEELRIKQFLQACHVLLIDEKVEGETIRLRKLTSLSYRIRLLQLQQASIRFVY